MYQPVQQYPGACAWQARGRRCGFPRAIRRGKRRGRRKNSSPASRVLPIELYTGLAVGDHCFVFRFDELVFSLYRTTSPRYRRTPPVGNAVDLGYVTVDPGDRRIVISGRIREEFENGRDYYQLQGRLLAHPSDPRAG